MSQWEFLIPVSFDITLENPIDRAGFGWRLLLPDSPLASGILGRVTKLITIMQIAILLKDLTVGCQRGLSRCVGQYGARQPCADLARLECSPRIIEELYYRGVSLIPLTASS